ncbi:Fumarate hydratase class I, aerobic [Dissulfuribacter thermophilus]|uniref:Fumarate hydratase class I, aerobic n=1 Tax=Dissulfuribacter thermophilus TaxID=1156395 RepID=A0A1B9F7C3_9BACT|nr:FumA C-terminus/TtdB family hydratase beta subunit [Dissulfuribacter thermophilus]OCC15661.1 Fumarate hydratase class I, aerobic [Dissulfuribacter thermophilus]
MITLNPPLKKDSLKGLKAGEWVSITGVLYTARDQTHRRIVELMEKGETLPIDLTGAILYYVGPTPTPPDRICGAVGPTTSYRMDAYTPKILELGVLALMGKGKRSPLTKEALKQHGAIYLATLGGAGAYLSEKVKAMELVAFADLGPEALYKMEVEDFPAIVINDLEGNDYYETVLSGK